MQKNVTPGMELEFAVVLGAKDLNRTKFPTYHISAESPFDLGALKAMAKTFLRNERSTDDQCKLLLFCAGNVSREIQRMRLKKEPDALERGDEVSRLSEHVTMKITSLRQFHHGVLQAFVREKQKIVETVAKYINAIVQGTWTNDFVPLSYGECIAIWNEGKSKSPDDEVKFDFINAIYHLADRRWVIFHEVSFAFYPASFLILIRYFLQQGGQDVNLGKSFWNRVSSFKDKLLPVVIGAVLIAGERCGASCGTRRLLYYWYEAVNGCCPRKVRPLPSRPI